MPADRTVIRLIGTAAQRSAHAADRAVVAMPGRSATVIAVWRRVVPGRAEPVGQKPVRIRTCQRERLPAQPYSISQRPPAYCSPRGSGCAGPPITTDGSAHVCSEVPGGHLHSLNALCASEGPGYSPRLGVAVALATATATATAISVLVK